MRKQLPWFFLLVLAMLAGRASATKLVELRVVDREYLMLLFRDGEVRYRDDATGASAYLGHTFIEGDDTLKVFLPRLNVVVVGRAGEWTVRSDDDKGFGTQHAVEAWRRSKPMHTDHTLTSELDHWVFLRLPRPMRQGCTYTVDIPAGVGADVASADVRFDIWTTPSERENDSSARRICGNSSRKTRWI